uniref:Retrovirus-related Pol polyprotein from transposon TNT 1-94 n=1 Tax=Tanacetum cinerariifolium TaxID=118510 RepID=A0A6L2NII6_TANCI|nr:retrovirus-related Pol polyprotein from transposon TNT 1-94 [Tanacetum cinerariifolium]
MSWKIVVIHRWNVAGALHNRKGIILFNSPRFNLKNIEYGMRLMLASRGLAIPGPLSSLTIVRYSSKVFSGCLALLVPLVEGLSKADLVETKCRTEDPFRDKSVTSGIRASRFEAMAIETEKNGASGSTVMDENRGRDDVRQNPKNRGAPKDVVASLDKRVAGVETSITELKTQVEGLEGLDFDFTTAQRWAAADSGWRRAAVVVVVVGGEERYTWTRFLKDKIEAFDQFEIFSKKIQNQLGCTIVSIRTDHGREFDNEVLFGEFCNANGITHNFSAPRTPQLNGVVERKNRTPQEMSRTMLNEQSLQQKFWCNVVDTSTYILNRILIRAILEKTPYELLRGRKPTLDYFGVYGSRKVKESLNVTLDETHPPSKTSTLVDDDLDEEEAIKVTEKKNLENDIEDETLEIDNCQY